MPKNTSGVSSDTCWQSLVIARMGVNQSPWKPLDIGSVFRYIQWHPYISRDIKGYQGHCSGEPPRKHLADSTPKDGGGMWLATPSLRKETHMFETHPVVD